MFKRFSVKKLVALLLVGAVVMPSMVSAQVLYSPVSLPTVSMDVGVNGYPSNPNTLLQNAYVGMYRVTPVIAGVYEGTLVSIKSTGTAQHATFNVRPNDVVDFVGFTDLTKARNTTRYTFTAPPYKNFAAVDGVRGRLCQINFLDKTTKLQSNGADSCGTSLSYPASDSSVVIIPKKYPTRRYGNVEVWAQETNDPLTRVRGAEISLYDELTGAKLGSATSDRGIVTFVVETNRPFYYQATKDGKNYGGRLASATETPRVFVITSDRKHTQNYYNAEKSAVMRLGAYPNNYVAPTHNPVVTAPDLSLSVSQASITKGQSTTLFWSSSDSVYCVASGGWGGNQVLNGSQTVNPATTTTYNLTCTGVGGSIKKSVTVTVLPALSTTPVETCEPFNASVAAIRTFPGWEGYYLTGFQNYSRAFPSMAEAQQALDFAKKNNMTWACKTSVPGTKDAIEYWLNSSKTAPIGSTEKDAGEDCVNFNLANVTINQNYTLVDGNHLIATNSTLAAAKVMKSVWNKYGFNDMCYVGRPDPSMIYYKRSSTVPTPAETCNSPYVMYQGVCTDPIPACKNPPANIVPSTCIDKIENGVYIERYSFSCMSGYVKSGKECVRTATPATTISISASPRSIVAGQSATLSWSATNAVNCSASNGWSGAKATSGSITVAPNSTTTYALTCYNTVTNDASAASTTVTVTPASSPTSCVKPASVTKAMFGGTSWVLSTTNKTYDVKVENITTDNKVQFLINGDRLVGVSANAVPQVFSDFNSTNGNDGTIQVYSITRSANLNQSIVAFKISEKVATGSVKCSTSNEIIRLMYVNDPQTYTTSTGKVFNVTLERVYGGTTMNEKKADLLINGDRMIGVPWDDNAKQHFGAAHTGDDGTVTISFINNTVSPNFAVITILAD